MKNTGSNLGGCLVLLGMMIAALFLWVQFIKLTLWLIDKGW